LEIFPPQIIKIRACRLQTNVKVMAFETRDTFLRHNVDGTIVDLQGGNFSRISIPRNKKQRSSSKSIQSSVHNATLLMYDVRHRNRSGKSGTVKECLLCFYCKCNLTQSNLR